MWKQISTVGYKNIVVEFDLSASGLSEIPHGFRPWGQGYNQFNGDDLPWTNHSFRPYHTCKGDSTNKYIRCPDAYIIDELFTVCYTYEYDSPYDERGIPVFHDPNNYAIIKGIAKWDVAKIISRKVLIEDYSTAKKVVLDFSGRLGVNNTPNFGLWFRAQLDSGDDKIYIDNIKIYGQRN